MSVFPTCNRAPGPSTLSVAPYAADYAGNINTAGVISVGGTATGNIGVIGQNDWFKVTP